MIYDGVFFSVYLNGLHHPSSSGDVGREEEDGKDDVEVIPSSYKSKAGFYFCAISVLLSGLVLVLIDFHKRRLRFLRRKRDSEAAAGRGGGLCHTKSIASTTTFASSTCPTHSSAGSHRGSFLIVGGNSASGLGIPSSDKPILIVGDPKSEGGHSVVSLADRNLSLGEGSNGTTMAVEAARKLSFSDHDDIINVESVPAAAAAVELFLASRNNTSVPAGLALITEEEAILEEEEEEEEDNANFDADEMDYLENITSCNKVENCVVLSEFEQNLSKECEAGSSSGSYAEDEKSVSDKERSSARSRRWRPSSVFGRSTKSRRGSSSSNRKMQTVIEENSV